jgi:hypothetical protein
MVFGFETPNLAVNVHCMRFASRCRPSRAQFADDVIGPGGRCRLLADSVEKDQQ